MPQFVARKGVHKCRADTDDVISLFAMLDAKHVTLPTFTASNLARLPSFLPSVAAEALANNPAVSALEEAVQDLQGHMAAVL
jgi:hypothetical protein